MNPEEQFSAIASTIIDVDASARYADRELERLRSSDAPDLLVRAVEQCRDDLHAASRRLLKRTYAPVRP